MCKALWKIGEWGCHSTMLITVSALVCSLPWFTKQSTESLLIIIAFFAGPSLQLHVTVNIPEPGWHRLPHRGIPAEVDYLKLYFPKTDQHLLTPWWEQPQRLLQLTEHACITLPEDKLQDSDPSAAIHQVVNLEFSCETLPDTCPH